MAAFRDIAAAVPAYHSLDAAASSHTRPFSRESGALGERVDPGSPKSASVFPEERVIPLVPGKSDVKQSWWRRRMRKLNYFSDLLSSSSFVMLYFHGVILLLLWVANNVTWLFVRYLLSSSLLFPLYSYATLVVPALNLVKTMPSSWTNARHFSFVHLECPWCSIAFTRARSHRKCVLSR